MRNLPIGARINPGDWDEVTRRLRRIEQAFQIYNEFRSGVYRPETNDARMMFFLARESGERAPEPYPSFWVQMVEVGNQRFARIHPGILNSLITRIKWTSKTAGGDIPEYIQKVEYTAPILVDLPVTVDGAELTEPRLLRAGSGSQIILQFTTSYEDPTEPSSLRVDPDSAQVLVGEPKWDSFPGTHSILLAEIDNDGNSTQKWHSDFCLQAVAGGAAASEIPP